MEPGLTDDMRRFLTEDGMADLTREAAFAKWREGREDWQDRTRNLFNRCYLGHFSHVDHYVETLIDRYELDGRLDAAVAPPFRDFVDVDVTALARWFVKNGTIFAVTAIPVGVWVFTMEVG